MFKRIIKQNFVVKVFLIVSMLFSMALSAEVPEGAALSEKQQLVRNNGAEPQSLDPHKIVGVPESNLVRDLFEGLTLSNANGEIIPGMATHWENIDDYVWRFYLRKEAKWSNGDPLTANDFVYSWRRVVDPKTASLYANFLQYAHLENVDAIIQGEKAPDALGVKALDDYTLEITLEGMVPYLPKVVAHSTLVPVHQKTVETYGDKWTQPQNIVTNAAYRLKEWVVNERITLERNTHYWDNEKTIIDQVTFLPISSEITDFNFYRSGITDMTASVPLDLFHQIKRERPQELRVDPYLCTYYYALNNEAEPFTNMNVREALKLGLNRDIIVNRVKNHGEQKAFGLTPPYTAGMNAKEPEWFHWTQEKRNERAIELLKDAGYSKQNPLTFTFLYNTSEGHKKIAIAVSSIWKQNLEGMVNVKIMNQEWKTFLDSRYQGNYQMSSSGWCADYDEPSTFLNIMIGGNSINTSRYRNAHFDDLMLKSATVKSDAERALIYQAAETQLDQDSAIIPIYYYVTARLVKPYVGGYLGNDPLNNIYTKNLYILKHDDQR